jgi:hypothetical protein
MHTDGRSKAFRAMVAAAEVGELGEGQWRGSFRPNIVHDHPGYYGVFDVAPVRKRILVQTATTLKVVLLNCRLCFVSPLSWLREQSLVRLTSHCCQKCYYSSWLGRY